MRRFQIGHVSYYDEQSLKTATPFPFFSFEFFLIISKRSAHRVFPYVSHFHFRVFSFSLCSLSVCVSSANLNISRDTTLDPALKRTKAVRCIKCGNDEACFFARSDEKMELVFVCTNADCAYHWTQNKEKDEEK